MMRGTMSEFGDAVPVGPEREVVPIHGRGDWLAMRRRDVTASEIAALFGAHPYRTPLQLHLSKTTGGGDAGDNPSMRRGRIMEPAIAAAVAEERRDWRLWKATDYYRLPALRLGATPDYLADYAGRLGVVECKSVAPEKFEEWGGAPSLAYTLQVVAQMMATGAEWGVIALLVMNRSLDLEIFPVPRHPAAEAKIAEAVEAFWHAVERGEAPPAVMPRDAATLAAMFPRDDGSTLDLTADNLLPELLAERATLKAEVGERDGRLDAIDAEIKAKLGPAAKATARGWRISYATSHRKETILPPRDIRTLRITKTKGE